MNAKFSPPLWLLPLASALIGFLQVPGLRADDGRIAVDVVVDFGGDSHQEKLTKKVVRPTPEQPAYYLPLFVGHKDVGFADYVMQAPPDAAVKRLLVDALASQGYLIMTRQARPSLVLAFWWGYMGPVKSDPQQFNDINPGSASLPGGMSNNPAFGSAMDPNSALQAVFNSQLPSQLGFQIHRQMLSMVAGDTLKDRRHAGDDPQMHRAIAMAREPIYYILISAYDFDAWLRHKRILIWQAHLSTKLWGHSFDEVLTPMIAAGTPLFGRETKEPQFFDAAVQPLPNVVVGTPVLKDYPAAPPAKNP